jgi:NTP pyrophosphatase (non-canonical NTP hydrolase)
MSCILCNDKMRIHNPETGEDICPCPTCLPEEYKEWADWHYDVSLGIKGWQKEAQKYTHTKLGHWLKGKDQVPLAFCYLHSEISEDFDHWRDDEPLGEDLADLALRLFQTAEDLGIDLEHEMIKKMKKNWTRPPKHGRKRVV